MQRPLATVVIGGVIAAMVMSLLVLRVLYLVFDGLAHGVYRLITGMGFPRHASASLLGLDVEKGFQSEDATEASSRSVSADAPAQLTSV